MGEAYARHVLAVLKQMRANGPEGPYAEALTALIGTIEPNVNDLSVRFGEMDLVNTCMALARARIRRDGKAAVDFAAACYDVTIALGIELEEEEQPRWFKAAAALTLPA